MKSEAEVKTIKGAASNLHSTISGMTTGNLFMAILVGGAMQQLFGMIRLIQILML